jgi:hypothetical protein
VTHERDGSLDASAHLGWPPIYVSQQQEGVFDSDVDAVADHLVILQFNGLVTLECRFDGRRARSIVACSACPAATTSVPQVLGKMPSDRQSFQVVKPELGGDIGAQ